MMNNTIQDLWALQLSDFFIKNHKYQLMTLNKETHDIWLTNPEHPKYQIIMITAQTTDTINYEIWEHHRLTLSTILQTQGDSLILSVNDHSTLMDPRTAIVSDKLLSREELELIYPGLKTVLKPTSNIRVSLNKVQNSISKNMRKLQRSKTISNNRVTLGLSAILLAVFLYTYYFAITRNISFNQALFVLGAYNKEFMVLTKQYYRFITPMFLHASVLHLLMNSLSMRNLGVLLEKEMGSWRYLLTIVLGTLYGTAFLFVRSEVGMVVGISAGIYALLGVLVVYLFEKDLLKNRMIRMNIISTFLLNLYISLMPNVSMTGHLGGLFIGVILGFLFSKREDWKGIRKFSLAMLLASMTYLVFLIIQTNNILL